MSLSVIILAAGQGTRMHSDLPKVLHPLANQPMIAHVLATAKKLQADSLHVVYGHKGELLQTTLADEKNLHWAEQAQQLGTGHAVKQALPAVPADNKVLILYGDVPLIAVETLQPMATLNDNTLGLLTVCLDNPTGYGRIVRDENNQVQAIVEQKETNAIQAKINEVNTGILSLNAKHLSHFIEQLNNDNTQGEYYLTDIIDLAVKADLSIQTFNPQSEQEVLGVNNRLQLAQLERYYQQQQAENLMQQGVTVIDPARLDIRGNVTVGRDVQLDVNVILQGNVTLGHRVKIGANTILTDVTIGDDVEILPNCLLEQATVGNGCLIGPFARLRPETQLAKNVKIGNFVEIKKSVVADGSKISHLSYIGDSQIGKKVNIGAGTITCNYDGVNKHQTIIGDNAFIGSDTQLIAPVTVGNGATIGAGSTITRDTPAEQLTLSRVQQQSMPHWQRPVKK